MQQLNGQQGIFNHLTNKIKGMVQSLAIIDVCKKKKKRGKEQNKYYNI